MFWQAYRYILQNMDKKDSHIELLDRFFRGLTSPEEDVQLKSWIKQPDFQQKFSAYYQQCWALAPDTMDKAVQNEMFTELLSQIDASSTTETKVLKTRNRFCVRLGAMLQLPASYWQWEAEPIMQESNDRPMTPIQKSPCPYPTGRRPTSFWLTAQRSTSIPIQELYMTTLTTRKHVWSPGRRGLF